jgi:hypothetical protein
MLYPLSYGGRVGDGSASPLVAGHVIRETDEAARGRVRDAGPTEAGRAKPWIVRWRVDGQLRTRAFRTQSEDREVGRWIAPLAR